MVVKDKEDTNDVCSLPFSSNLRSWTQGCHSGSSVSYSHFCPQKDFLWFGGGNCMDMVRYGHVWVTMEQNPLLFFSNIQSWGVCYVTQMRWVEGICKWGNKWRPCLKERQFVQHVGWGELLLKAIWPAVTTVLNVHHSPAVSLSNGLWLVQPAIQVLRVDFPLAPGLFCGMEDARLDRPLVWPWKLHPMIKAKFDWNFIYIKMNQIVSYFYLNRKWGMGGRRGKEIQTPGEELLGKKPSNFS